MFKIALKKEYVSIGQLLGFFLVTFDENINLSEKRRLAHFVVDSRSLNISFFVCFADFKVNSHNG
jgi:hypothetical protein